MLHNFQTVAILCFNGKIALLKFQYIKNYKRNPDSHLEFCLSDL